MFGVKVPDLLISGIGLVAEVLRQLGHPLRRCGLFKEDDIKKFSVVFRELKSRKPKMNFEQNTD